MIGPDQPDAQRLIASFPMAVILLAPDRTVAAINPAGEDLLGQGAQRSLGQAVDTLVAFVEPGLGERFAHDDQQVFARDALVRLAKAPPRRLDVMLSPVAQFPGWRILALHETVGMDTVGGDGASGAVGAPAVLAHEIKNPLAGIRGAAQLLARSAQGPDRALTDLITSEVDRVAALVDRMQTLGRRHGDPASPCNVHEAARRALTVIEASGDRTVRIAEDFDPALPLVLCNSDALVQVLLNLLSNAAEACASEAQPRIAVRTRFAGGLRLHGAPGEAAIPLPIELRVSDNGPGVDRQLVDRIFEPFVSSKPAGQGLGLALVQKLVHEMNGRITHDRDEERGLTHFRLHLPVADEARAVSRAAA